MIYKLWLNRKYRLSKIFIPAIIFIISGSLSYSQELEPRGYSVIPKDVKGLAFGYSLSSGAIVTDATSPFSDFDVISHSAYAGAFRSFGIFGKLARAQFSVPFVYMSGDLKVNGKDTTGTRIGFGDARFRLGVNIFGSPALSPKDFKKFKEEVVLGTSVVVSIPTGQYDNTKIINLGSNRWGFKPEIGFSYGYNRFYFEMYSGVWLFTPNNEYLQTKTLKQDPIISLQAHIIYTFRSNIWLGLDGNYFFGGKSQIDGIYQKDIMKNSRFGGVVGYSFDANHSLKFQAHTGVVTFTGSSYTVFTLLYQYIWF